MTKNFDRDLLADVAERLIHHLKNRTDVQNIDLMNLSGFCRNCLSKWYVSAAEKKNISISYDEAREMIYGMPYACLLYTSPSPRDRTRSRMPSSA